jgi:hypothetical protein
MMQKFLNRKWQPWKQNSQIKEQFGEEDLALAERITDHKIALGQKEVEATQLKEKQKVDALKNGVALIASALNKIQSPTKRLPQFKQLCRQLRVL